MGTVNNSELFNSHITEECDSDQECVLLANCLTTRELKLKADVETNEFAKMALLDTLKSLSCGRKLEKTICCDKNLTGKMILQKKWKSPSSKVI